jgi:hypothetical protein
VFNCAKQRLKEITPRYQNQLYYSRLLSKWFYDHIVCQQTHSVIFVGFWRWCISIKRIKINFVCSWDTRRWIKSKNTIHLNTFSFPFSETQQILYFKVLVCAIYEYVSLLIMDSFHNMLKMNVVSRISFSFSPKALCLFCFKLKLNVTNFFF